MQGFIKDYRKELESDIWSMPPLYHRTWQWLKYNVNHEDATIPMRDGSHLTIKRGQRLTSVRDIAKSVGWYEGTKWKEPNPKTVSTILDWMGKTGMISIERGQGNRQYTLITLIKYEDYQQKNIQGNSKVTAEKHLADINKNEKNDKEKKHIGDSDECTNRFEEFWKSYPKKQGKAPALSKWQSFWKAKQINFDEVTEGLTRYLAFIDHERTVRKFDRQYLDGRTFISQRQWESEWKIDLKPVKSNRAPTQMPLYKPTPEELKANDLFLAKQRERNQQFGRAVGEHIGIPSDI